MKKEADVIRLFYDEPTKQWHFEEILRTAQISRPQATFWLRKFISEGIIQKIYNKRPFYTANYTEPKYQITKKLYALTMLEQAGLLEYLAKLPEATLVILFGSFSRWDWFSESDVDIFVYGNSTDINVLPFQKKLRYPIEIFRFIDENALKQVSKTLIRNIERGFVIKGDSSILAEIYG